MARLIGRPDSLVYATLHALLSGAIALLPYETVRGWGELIRNADDVTADRFQRFRFIAIFGFVSGLSAFVWVWWHRSAVSQFFAELFGRGGDFVFVGNRRIWGTAIGSFVFSGGTNQLLHGAMKHHWKFLIRASSNSEKLQTSLINGKKLNNFKR